MHGEDLSGQLKRQEHHGVIWLDTEAPGRETLAALERDFRLHPLHVTESLQRVQHSQIERESNYLFLVLHYPVRDPQTGKLTIGQVGLFLGKDFLITIRSTGNTAVENLFRAYHADAERAGEAFKQGAGYVLYEVIKHILSEISDMTDSVISELDEIEDLVFDNDSSDAQRIGEVRQKIVRLMRIIGPKRLILKDLAEQIDSFTGQNLTKYYSNNTKTVNKLWEIIEEAKETVEIFKDADFTTSTERTNEVLAVLTILFTFTIPISVIGTIYGMNVPLPGGITAGAWSFAGRYTTLLVLIVLSSCMALAMYVYFRYKKWF